MPDPTPLRKPPLWISRPDLALNVYCALMVAGGIGFAISECLKDRSLGWTLWVPLIAGEVLGSAGIVVLAVWLDTRSHRNG